MNRVKLTLTATVFLLLGALPALAAGSFFTGAKYLQLPENERNLLVQGLWDGWDQGTSIFENAWGDEGRAFVNRASACTKTLSSSQLREMLDAYFQAHPETTHYSLGSSFQVALQQGCP